MNFIHNIKVGPPNWMCLHAILLQQLQRYNNYCCASIDRGCTCKMVAHVLIGFRPQ